MALELHSNDNARESRPGVWVFQGRSVVLLVIGVGLFVALFRILAAYNLDWYFVLPISLAPLASLIAFVQLFVNGKPGSYFQDVLLFGLWKLKTAFFNFGAKVRPPLLWIAS